MPISYYRDIVAAGHGTLKPWLFAVHSTANEGATAKNHRDYWKREPNYAVHLVSDWNEAIQCVEFDRKCWQVGNGNNTCIGLEICEATNYTDFKKGLEIARNVIREVLDAYDWGFDVVHSHKWFTENYGGSDHTDPDPYLNKWGWSWQDFVNYLREEEPKVEHKVSLTPFENRADQKWFRKYDEDGNIIGLRNAENWWYLSDPNSSVKTTNAELWGDDGEGFPRAPQRLIVENAEDGWCYIHPECSVNLSLDVQGGSSKENTIVQWYPTNHSRAQKWAILSGEQKDVVQLVSALNYMILGVYR